MATRTIVTMCALAFLAGISPAGAQDKPLSLVTNGGFERSGGWAKPPGAEFADSGRTGRCILFTNQGSATQDYLPEGPQRTFSCSVDVRTEGIVPGQNGGFAYAAVYQLDATGQWVAFKDFAQVRGDSEWTRYDFTFEMVPRAETISLRCGIYNASGKAWFDNWTLVEGDRAYGYNEVQGPSAGEARDVASIAIFREEGFPAKGAAANPEHLSQLLAGGGFSVSFLTSSELADPRRFNSGRYGMVVLPYGQTFPAAARSNLIRFLKAGGSFISTGGYAFEDLRVRQGEEWIPESVALEQRLQEALEQSVLFDGGFETTQDMPVGGMELDGQWRRDGGQCEIVAEGAREGARCARVRVRAEDAREERIYLDLKPEPGQRYRVTGWVRTEDVRPLGTGYAYLALYEYGDGDKLGEWEDFASVQGTTEWKQFHYDFSPVSSTTRLHIKMGLYHAIGTAWFDDIRLAKITAAQPSPLNTSTGNPQDGLQVAPSQIGVFDASFPLRRASAAVAGDEQYIVPAGARIEGPLVGWAAAGVQGYDNARWIELLDGRDRFGRKRGAAGALMINYNGFYAGSMWGYFGVENRDLFDGSSPAADQGLVNLARFISRGAFLRNLRTDRAMYEQGETVVRKVAVENYGAEDRACSVTFEVIPGSGSGEPVARGTVEVTVPAGAWREVESPWRPEAFASDDYRVRAVLQVGEEAIDEMTSGFLVRTEPTVAAGPRLTYRDNYFHLDGEPLFLFGSDVYAYTYQCAHENPWTWRLDHTAARDYGFNIDENLQYSNAPAYTFSDDEWRQFEGMAQSAQKQGLVFMPCQLVGHNVAIGDEMLQAQAAQCTAYGEHMRQFPGLLYYLNGDYRLELDDLASLKVLWNRWLAGKYADADALEAAWGNEIYGDWGDMVYPPPRNGDWSSARACDQARFEVSLTTRWNEAMVKAVRAADTEHPITSEYYRQTYGGLDMVLSIDGQDAGGIGYFDAPNRDIDFLPLCLRLVDMRMRGKSPGLGEYGVKTHPAWAVENGAVAYHPVRTEEEQKRLFMTVAHYTLSMGGSKVQNWCLRDASHWVFPWGVFYPNGRIPKDVASWHRNLSLVWRHFRPVYKAPPVAVLLPDNMRLGNNSQTGVEVAFNAFRALLQLQVDFNVINEHHIGALTNSTKYLIWPSAFCPDDACYEKVLAWVKAGGTLLVTGDISLNWDRKRTRTERLTELCGVEFVAERYLPPVRPEGGVKTLLDDQEFTLNPCIVAEPVREMETVSTVDGTPVLFARDLGEGTVAYCADPLEMGATEDVLPALKTIYSLIAEEALDEDWTGRDADIHICRQPLRSGGQFTMAFNTNMPPGAKTVTLPAGDADVKVRVAARYPALTATRGEQLLVAVGCSGEATFDGQPLVSGEAQVIYLSLDGRALPVSQAALLCPFSAGATQLHLRNAEGMSTVIGDIEDGKWRTLEVREGAGAITLDDDLMTALVVLCPTNEIARWTKAVEDALRRPQGTAGY